MSTDDNDDTEWTPNTESFSIKARDARLTVHDQGGIPVWIIQIGTNGPIFHGRADTIEDAKQRCLLALPAARCLAELGLGHFTLAQAPPAPPRSVDMMLGAEQCLICGAPRSFKSRCFHTEDEIRTSFRLIMRVPRA